MSTEDSNDMDVFVSLRKADSQGNLLRNINIPLKDLGMEADEVPLVNPLVYIGPSGILRASHRKVDAAKSKPYWPFHPHDERELLEPGQIVKLDIGLWPAGIVFEAGEKLMLRVSGHHMVLAEFEPLRGGFKTDNKGRHNVHVGPEYQSHVILPFVHSDVVCRSK
jgi:predicted acyl esterase